MPLGRGRANGSRRSGPGGKLTGVTDDLRTRPIDLLDPAQQESAVQWLAVHAAAQRRLFGERGSTWTLPELQAFHRKPDKKRFDRAAWCGGRILGAVEVLLPLHDNPRLALLWLSVDPDHRRRGIGTALLEEAERIAAEQGRTVLFVETEWAQDGRDESGMFAARHGYVNAQTMLRSELALPVNRSALAAVRDQPGGQDYAIESFVDDMPQEWLDDRAVLQQRMSTDAPLDDLEMEEEVWDADRLRQEQAATKAAGRRVVESVARHLPSGRLVGFTSISVSSGTPDLGHQQDTLVLTEHRGHALGLRLKAANALRLMDELPDVTAIRTWNAVSNEHMLAVNRRLGYIVDGYSAEWQKVAGPGT
jgi:GNAT superfamily N-acetyltransferase